jgi:hypothetical protein
MAHGIMVDVNEAYFNKTENSFIHKSREKKLSICPNCLKDFFFAILDLQFLLDILDLHFLLSQNILATPEFNAL